MLDSANQAGPSSGPQAESPVAAPSAAAAPSLSASPPAGRLVPTVIGALIAFAVLVMLVDSMRGDNSPEAQMRRAVDSGDLRALRQALAAGALVNHPSPGMVGDTVLHVAAWRNQLSIARVLIEHGADVNRRQRYTGETPLHSAVRGNNPEMVDLLMAAGADPQLGLKSASEQCLSGHVYPAGSNAIDIARQAGYDRVLARIQAYR